MPLKPFLALVSSALLCTWSAAPLHAQQDFSDPYTLSTLPLQGGGGGAGSVDGDVSLATFRQPTGMVKDSAGNLYVADTGNHKIRKITPGGVVSTFAGASTAGATDGQGTAASFYHPAQLAIDSEDNLYVADSANEKIRKITPTGLVSTFAGSGTPGYLDGSGTTARFSSPKGVVVGNAPSIFNDGSKVLFVADTLNNKIRAVSLATQQVATVAEGGSLNQPHGLAFSTWDNSLVIADTGNHAIRKLVAPWAATNLTVLSGVLGQAGDVNGDAATSRYRHPVDITVNNTVPNGCERYVVESGNHRVRKVAAGGVSTTVAGDGTKGWLDGASSTARFNEPQGILMESSGSLLVADTTNNLIRRLSLSGDTTSTLAGGGGLGASSGFDRPRGITTHEGSLYVSDFGNKRVAVVGPDNSVSVLNGATPLLYGPTDIVVRPDGEVLIADAVRRIIRVTPAGEASVFAGSGEVGNQDGQGTGASFYNISSIALDPAGNLFVADNCSVRKVTPGGQVSLYAGSTVSGFAEGPKAGALFHLITGIAVAADGTVYVTDWGNRRVRKITPGGDVVTVAGNGSSGWVDGPAASARFGNLLDVALDGAGRLSVLDGDGTRVRRITPAGVVSSLLGATTAGMEDGPAGTGRISAGALCVDADGRLHIADTQNQRIRRAGYEAAQAISFAEIANRSMSNPTLQLSATASSGLPVGFAVVSGPAVVTGNTLTLTGGGNVSVAAHQGGNLTYGAASPVVRTFTVSQLSQTVSFATMADRPYSPTPIPLSATASSGLPVEYTVLSGPATVSGGNLTLTGVGTVSVRASQPGNSVYTAANPVIRTFNVNMVSQTITFTGPDSVYLTQYGVPLVATASSGLPVSFSLVSGYGNITDGKYYHSNSTGSVTIRASQAGNGNYYAATSVTKTFTVSKAPQVIDFPAVGPLTLQNLTHTLPAISSSGLDVLLTVVSGPGSISYGTKTLTLSGTAGTVKVRATQVGNYQYDAAATVERDIIVQLAPQTITFGELANQTFPATVQLSATASSGLAVSYTHTGPATRNGSTLTLTGGGTVSVTASQAGSTRYAAAQTVTRSFNVSKAAQTLTVQPIADRPFVYTGTVAVSASSSAGLVPTVSVVGGPAVMANSTTVRMTGAGEITLKVSQAGSTAYDAAPDQTVKFTATPQSSQQLQVFVPQVGYINHNGSLVFAATNPGMSGYHGIVVINRTAIPVQDLECVLTGNSPGEYEILEPMPSTLAASGDSGEVPIMFLPARLGWRYDTLSIRNRNGDAAAFVINLAGRGALDASFADMKVETAPRSTVVASFRLVDPDGVGLNLPEAVVGAPGFFRVLENGTAPASEMHIQVGKGTDVPTITRTVIMIDNSLQMSTRLAAARAAAKEMIRDAEPNQEFAIYSFSETVVKRQAFTKDKAVLGAALDAIPGTDLLPSRNLNGAMIQGLGEWTDSVTTSSVVRGSLVVLTAGPHTTGGPTQADVLAARGSKRVHIMGAVTGLDMNQFTTVANAGVISLDALGDFSNAFLFARVLIAQDEHSLYFVSYISPKRGSEVHQLKIRMPDNENLTAASEFTGSFNSAGFTSELSEVVVNRSFNQPRGVTSITEENSLPVFLNAFTILPADSFTPAAYTWSVDRPDLVALQVNGASATLVPLGSGTVQVTVTDTVNQPYGSNYRKVITVSFPTISPGNLYDGWALLANLTGDAAEPGAVPRHDGVPNLLKYAFNMNPALPDNRVLPADGTAGLPRMSTTTTTGGSVVLRLEYLRRKDSGLIYTPQWSATLSGFTTMTGQTNVVPVDAKWERVTIERTATAGERAGFARVHVSCP